MDRKLIFDGTEDAFYEFEIAERLKITDFQSLQHFSELLTVSSFKDVVEQTSARIAKPFNWYKFGIEEFTGRAAFLPRDNSQLLVISAGETQPGRFKIFWEGLVNVDRI